MKKIKVKMKKPVYLGFSILEVSKTLMYEFWYDHIKSKYQSNARIIELYHILMVKMLEKYVKQSC